MIEVDEEEYKQLLQDLSDMHNAIGTIFVRCPGCGRLGESGFICPSNQEVQGSCEEGL